MSDRPTSIFLEVTDPNGSCTIMNLEVITRPTQGRFAFRALQCEGCGAAVGVGDAPFQPYVVDDSDVVLCLEDAKQNFLLLMELEPRRR